MNRVMTGMGVLGIVVGLTASPALAFRCPSLIKQANDAIVKAKLDDAKLKQVKDLISEAQRLHNAGQHGDSVRKADEALVILGVKAESPPARRGY